MNDPSGCDRFLGSESLCGVDSSLLRILLLLLFIFAGTLRALTTARKLIRRLEVSILIQSIRRTRTPESLQACGRCRARLSISRLDRSSTFKENRSVKEDCSGSRLRKDFSRSSCKIVPGCNGASCKQRLCFWRRSHSSAGAFFRFKLIASQSLVTGKLFSLCSFSSSSRDAMRAVVKEFFPGPQVGRSTAEAANS
jgi:hypothetical protein